VISRALLSLLLLCACQRTSQWQCQHLCEKNSHCCRLLYQSEDPVRGINLEFLQTEIGLCTYLQVRNPLPADAKIEISLADRHVSFDTPSHLGRQRVQLSQEAQDLLLAGLTEDQEVKIELSGCQEVIQTKNFSKLLKNFRSNRNPSFLKVKLL
jgi:hypothetical protein